MLKRILEEFLSIDGVSTAALVGRDGFVIEIAGTQPVDVDALGALGSSSMRFFDSGMYAPGMGLFRQLAIEYSRGVMIFTPVTRDEFLAIITESQAAVGRVKYVLEKSSQRVAAAM
jgi:uncharacterized protein